MKTRGEKYTFPMKIGAGNHTFLKKERLKRQKIAK